MTRNPSDVTSTMKPLLQPVGPAPAPIRWIGRLTDWSVIGIGATMTVLVLINVVLHLFHRDLAWVTELGELLMVWVTFLGGACAAQRGLHMSINEFVEKLAPAGRRRADMAILALSLAVLLLLVQHGWVLVNANWGNELTVLGWPMAWQYMGMLAGCSLMALFVACDLVQTARGIAREDRYLLNH